MDANLIFVQDELTKEINKKESVNFNNFFITRIFYILLQNSYTYIGKENVVLKKDDQDHYKWNTTYLIRIHFYKIFNFEKMVSMVNQRLSKRISKEYKLHFQTYLLDFQNTDCFEFIDEITQLSEQILLNEFGTIIDPEKNIVFKRNTRKLRFEYLVDILNEFKPPMHYTDLFEICLQREVVIASSLSVHSTMLNHPEIFGLKGPGIYGLLEWGGCFGKIGDVTEKKLRELNEPIDRKELEEFLVRELYISQDSIREVLFNYDLEHRFIKLKNDKISLKEWQ